MRFPNLLGSPAELPGSLLLASAVWLERAAELPNAQTFQPSSLEPVQKKSTWKFLIMTTNTHFHYLHQAHNRKETVKV